MALKLFDEKMKRKTEEKLTQFERDQLLSIFNSIDEIIYISYTKPLSCCMQIMAL